MGKPRAAPRFIFQGRLHSSPRSLKTHLRTSLPDCRNSAAAVSRGPFREEALANSRQRKGTRASRDDTRARSLDQFTPVERRINARAESKRAPVSFSFRGVSFFFFSPLFFFFCVRSAPTRSALVVIRLRVAMRVQNFQPSTRPSRGRGKKLLCNSLAASGSGRSEKLELGAIGFFPSSMESSRP